MKIDRLEISVTHEVMIDGEKSWVKYGVSGSVGPNESEETARKRASEHVNKGVLATLGETVETVRKATT